MKCFHRSLRIAGALGALLNVHSLLGNPNINGDDVCARAVSEITPHFLIFKSVTAPGNKQTRRDETSEKKIRN